jgi:alpha-beta hydrolase superfamily lysophospholipase
VINRLPSAVEISSPTRPTLRGHLYGQGPCWTVLVHDEGRDLDSWKSLVPELVQSDFCALAFDLCGHGASDDPWDPGQVVADVTRVLNFARSQGATKLYLLGAGMGGTASLAAADTHGVRAIVALSPRADLSSPQANIRVSTAPKLIMAGSRDKLAMQQASNIYDRVIGWSMLETPPVAEQGTDLLWSPWGGTLREHVLTFLRDYC